MKAGILQLVPHEHTAKIRPHSHTSYAGLTFVLVLVGILLLGSSWAASAAVPAVNPQTGSVGLSGTVRGPAPTVAAVVVTPRDNSRTNSTPVTVAGTCPINTFVSITKNAVFGGATPCLDDGTYSLQIDLFDGANVLAAEDTDALGQSGPASPTIHIFYDAPSLSLGGAVGRQLFIEASSTVQGGDPAQELARSATIVGGVGPYAISWDWGDNQTSLLSQANDGVITGKHSYARAGTYRVILRVTDAQGNSAFLQMVTVINGPVDAAGSNKGNGLGSLGGALLGAWPLYVMALLMVIFFWLGERREVHKLARRRSLEGV